jgi:hypothetical protein
MSAAAASGFKFSYGDVEVPRLLDPLQQKKCWEQEYKAYIKVSRCVLMQSGKSLVTFHCAPTCGCRGLLKLLSCLSDTTIKYVPMTAA